MLTVFAYHGSGCFRHVVLKRFGTGLRDAGHTNDIVGLHAKRVHTGDIATLQRDLDRADALGREF